MVTEAISESKSDKLADLIVAEVGRGWTTSRSSRTRRR